MVDPDRIRSKLGSLETYLRGLEEKKNCGESTYLQDRDLQDIVERRFEKAIRCCLDIASHIVATEGYREPTDYGDLFRILEEESILTSSTADRMVEMAGFRNVLAHEYADIVDEYVYAHLQDFEHFRTFAAEIAENLPEVE
ncbi:type VII toxin-antitoxin system HepT family RNase toxin [Halovivax gelatinilyticus]|uniref:type VII toxin-antitoxin system HepT family RNase toxin n=1 Tax=Halovivax gelatinilyticus TaxID=2961597 RepID=UPI0020CA6099|nr:DUF86 domain-containing protein [Halovivax gelatinilyticus]